MSRLCSRPSKRLSSSIFHLGNLTRDWLRWVPQRSPGRVTFLALGPHSSRRSSHDAASVESDAREGALNIIKKSAPGCRRPNAVHGFRLRPSAGKYGACLNGVTGGSRETERPSANPSMGTHTQSHHRALSGPWSVIPYLQIRLQIRLPRLLSPRPPAPATCDATTPAAHASAHANTSRLLWNLPAYPPSQHTKRRNHTRLLWQPRPLALYPSLRLPTARRTAPPLGPHLARPRHACRPPPPQEPWPQAHAGTRMSGPLCRLGLLAGATARPARGHVCFLLPRGFARPTPPLLGRSRHTRR